MRSPMEAYPRWLVGACKPGDWMCFKGQPLAALHCFSLSLLQSLIILCLPKLVVEGLFSRPPAFCGRCCLWRWDGEVIIGMVRTFRTWLRGSILFGKMIIVVLMRCCGTEDYYIQAQTGGALWLVSGRSQLFSSVHQELFPKMGVDVGDVCKRTAAQKTARAAQREV